ncbi:MAG: hypothetical protein IKH61_12950 [Bacteroidales bacterium]|nr:hypothetical protein [Bacteroidales bacterium]
MENITLEQVIERMTKELETLRDLASKTVGKYVSQTSLGHVKVEQGYGLNNTDYSFAFSHAVIFDTEKEAWDAGDLYLKTRRDGKQVDVYTSATTADSFFRNKAEELESTLNLLKSQSMNG